MTASLPSDDSSAQNTPPLGASAETPPANKAGGDASPASSMSVDDKSTFPASPIALPPVMPRKKTAKPTMMDQLWLPVFLLAATCFSTFFAGTMGWNHEWLNPILNGQLASTLMEIRVAMLARFDQGVIYMACVIGILFAHEMGHYVVTRIYKVPSSYPFFIPFVVAPFGTMGAVIAMQGQKADRKEIFDIGIAGPLAGLVLAIPITYAGVAQLDLSTPTTSSMPFDMPLLIKWMYVWLHPDVGPMPSHLYSSQMNPMFMAGWVGLLITGLNMLPVSQLDGGHVTYTLFGKHSRTIAQVFIGVAIAYMTYYQVFAWAAMLLLIFAIGIYHPPTADDSVPLGKGRIILGAISLLIPVLCFPPRGLAF